MRQAERQTTPEAAWAMVDSTDYAVLSLVDPEGLPYGVPLTLWRQGEDLFFHCAGEGLKTQCLEKDPHVSICCVAKAQVVPGAMTMGYASAILRGTAQEVTDPREKLDAMNAMCRRYGVPQDHPALTSGFRACLPKTAIWRIHVTSVTGKQRG